MGRAAAFGLAMVWVAMLGTFVGAVEPYWRAESFLKQAKNAMLARPPRYEIAEEACLNAQAADPLSARPWVAGAALEYRIWTERGASHEDLRWQKIPIAMLKSVSPPRSTESWTRHRERARMTGLLIKQIGEKIPPMNLTRYRGDIVNASRKAVQLYPTSASLRASLAEASAEIGMIPDAITEGEEALRLDDLMPHAQKKLEPTVRTWLESKLPEWKSQSKGALSTIPPARRPRSPSAPGAAPKAKAPG